MTVPKKWVDILFQRKSWDDETGLYIFAIPGNVSWMFQLVRVMSVSATNDPKRIAGAKFGIGGFAMLLGFGKPRFFEPGFETVHRPASLIFEMNGKQNQHLLFWEDRKHHGSIGLRIQESLEDAVGNSRPMVQPIRKGPPKGDTELNARS
jgi:hypothetical protein